jgi:hypothetical protein
LHKNNFHRRGNPARLHPPVAIHNMDKPCNMEAVNTEHINPAPAARTTMPRTQPIPTTRRFDAPTEGQPPKANEPAKPKPSKPKISHHIKLQQASPRLTLLLACVAYVVTALVALNIGFLNLSNHLQSRFERVKLEYQAQTSDLRKEQIIYGRLETLLSDQLSRGFMESHEDCLVRGLKKIDYELFGYGYQYSDIRGWVMDWTMENCGRLQYTPQVVHEEPSPQQAVMTYWANVSYRSRQMVERALGFVQQIWGRMFGRKHTQNTSADTEPAPAGNETAKASWDHRLRTKVPFGFQLDCEPSKPCRLFYPSALAERTDKTGVSPERIAKMAREARNLSKVSLQIARLQWAVEFALHRLVAPFQAFFALALLIASAFVPDPRPPQQKRPLTIISELRAEFPTERYFVVSMFIEFLAVQALYMLEKGLGARWPERVTMFLGPGMIFLGMNMLVRFFFASKKLEDIFRMCELVKEIYLIVRGHDLPGEKKEVANPSPVDDEPKKTTKEHAPQMSNSKKEEPTETKPNAQAQELKYVERVLNAPVNITENTKPHHRFADPTTSVQDDLEAERKNLQGELKQATLNARESGFDSDTDTDSDSDKESSFVDLASGVTPEITETESGWSLVD